MDSGWDSPSAQRIRKNLINIGDHYFLSENDPFYWEKLHKFQPENPEALYNIGLKKAENANEYLEKYNCTQEKSYLNLCKRKMEESLKLFKKAFNYGCVMAHRELIKTEHELTLLTIREKIDSAKSKPSRKLGKSIGIIAAIILLILLLFTLSPSIIAKDTQLTNNFNYLIPYQVIKEKPSTIPLNIYHESTIEIPQNSSEQETVNLLLDALKSSYTQQSGGPAKITALQENNGIHQEIGMALWPRDRNVKIYIYPVMAQLGNAYQLWETTTVIRSALYQFVRYHGYLPSDLHLLVRPFPENYLPSLPKEPSNLQNTVVNAFTGNGGWLYSPLNIRGRELSSEELMAIIEESLVPNLQLNEKIPFEPTSIEVDKTNHILTLLSGSKVMRSYPIATGQNDSTPEGDLWITKKVTLPNKFIPLAENDFGTRGLELSRPGYAIHGTNDPQGIGKDSSGGCIRLDNRDIEDLYAMTPLYTPVTISKNPLLPNNMARNNATKPSNPTTPTDPTTPTSPGLNPVKNSDLYDLAAKPQEEDNITVYQWK